MIFNFLFFFPCLGSWILKCIHILSRVFAALIFIEGFHCMHNLFLNMCLQWIIKKAFSVFYCKKENVDITINKYHFKSFFFYISFINIDFHISNLLFRTKVLIFRINFNIISAYHWAKFIVQKLIGKIKSQNFSVISHTLLACVTRMNLFYIKHNKFGFIYLSNLHKTVKFDSSQISTFEIRKFI